MKIIPLSLISFILVACTSTASLVSVQGGEGFAYIYTEKLTRTEDCSATSIKIVGIGQPNKNVVYLDLHSIHVPEGDNTVYYHIESESLKDEVCSVFTEEIIWIHGPPNKRHHSSGLELKVSVKAGTSYALIMEGGEVVMKEDASK